MTMTVRMTAIIAVVSLVVTGCPEINITDISLKPESVEPGKFTVAVTVTSSYEREICEVNSRGRLVNKDCEDDPELFRGRGIVGVWLPSGWTVTSARLKGSSDASSGLLEVLPSELGKGFPRTFPYTPGGWWPFISSCTDIPEGVTELIVELDISGPEEAQNVMAGVMLDYDWYGYRESDEQTFGQQPYEIHVDLATSTIRKIDHVREEVHMPEYTCQEIPTVERGQRGCSCTNVGANGARDSIQLGGLLGTILGLF